MKEFVRRVQSREQGFTLIELIASLTVFAMIAGIISGLTMFGVRSYDKITIQNELRDEADLIMSAIITKLYTYAPDKVQNINGGIELSRSGRETKEAIIVEGNQMIISGNGTEQGTNSPLAVRSELGDSKVTAYTADGRECTISSLCGSGTIEIDLVLKYKGNSDNMLELKSRFGY